MHHDMPITAPFTRRRALEDAPVWLTFADARRVRIEPHHAARLTAAFDLIVDLARERAVFAGRVIPLEACAIPLGLLAALVRSQGSAVAMADLFAMAWGQPFCQRFHHNTFHSQMSRLRRMIRTAVPDRELVVSEGASYHIPRGIRACVIEPVKPSPCRARRPETLVQLARARGFIDRRMVRLATGWSESRSHEMLQTLARAGKLKLEGSGRGARYRVLGVHP
jgi:hypothetical protein